MKKIRIENIRNNVGNKIRVFKTDFEICEFMNGYFGICMKGHHGADCVWGGDSGDGDCYNKKLAKIIYNSWDGELEYCGNYYSIDTSRIK